jgi:3-hydroxyacyl-[acyl-carrier-protein] dehydratase
MDIDQILEHLPHRYPFLMVDRVLSCEEGKEIVALKNVSVNEEFFNGHFPNHRVMPGVLVIEALAQASAILSFRTAGVKPSDGVVSYFVGIDAARFKRPVFPGDQLMLYSQLLKRSRGFWKFAARAEVAGVVVAEAELLCAEKRV